MSATISAIGRPAITARVSTFSRLFSACWHGIARYFVRRAAIASLRDLDDRGLRDIGLARGQIEAAVHGFMIASGRGEGAMTASSATLCAAIGPRAGGRRCASTAEAVPWN